MRTVLIACATAAGLGLAATSGSVAAPVNGAVLGQLATESAPVTQVYWHHGYGYHGYGHGYGYHGYGHGYWRHGGYWHRHYWRDYY